MSAWGQLQWAKPSALACSLPNAHSAGARKQRTTKFSNCRCITVSVCCRGTLHGMSSSKALYAGVAVVVMAICWMAGLFLLMFHVDREQQQCGPDKGGNAAGTANTRTGEAVAPLRPSSHGLLHKARTSARGSAGGGIFEGVARSGNADLPDYAMIRSVRACAAAVWPYGGGHHRRGFTEHCCLHVPYACHQSSESQPHRMRVMTRECTTVALRRQHAKMSPIPGAGGCYATHGTAWHITWR